MCPGEDSMFFGVSPLNFHRKQRLHIVIQSPSMATVFPSLTHKESYLTLSPISTCASILLPEVWTSLQATEHPR